MSTTRTSSSLHPLCRTRVSPSCLREVRELIQRLVVWNDGKETYISNPTDFPDAGDKNSWKVKEIQEPVVKATIIVPQGICRPPCFGKLSLTYTHLDYLGEMMDLCFTHRADDLDHRYLDASGSMDARIMLTCTIPLGEIVMDFFDKLKGRSSGFASFE